MEIEHCSQSDAENIEKLFSTEDKEIINGRASFELFIEKESGDDSSEPRFRIRFLMKAMDAAALRAVFTLIIKTIHVFEKSKQLVENT